MRLELLSGKNVLLPFWLLFGRRLSGRKGGISWPTPSPPDARRIINSGSESCQVSKLCGVCISRACCSADFISCFPSLLPASLLCPNCEAREAITAMVARKPVKAPALAGCACYCEPLRSATIIDADWAGREFSEVNGQHALSHGQRGSLSRALNDADDVNRCIRSLVLRCLRTGQRTSYAV